MQTYSLQDFLKYSSELATISPAAVELINKINLPNIRRDEIAKLVSADEVLFANIFKYTNSAAFGLKTKPRNINEAIDILGVNEVRNIVFSVAAKKVFVDLDLWRKSVFTAVTAQKLAKKINLNPNTVSDIYIAGLMHSIGSLVFKMFYKTEYAQIEKLRDYNQRVKLEEEIFGLNNLKLSYEILKDYNLPDSITNLIKNQALSQDDDNYEKENVILDLAIKLSEITREEAKEPFIIDRKIDFKLLNKFQLNELGINPDFIEEVYKETDNILQA